MQAGTYIDPVTSRLPHGTRAQVIDGWKTPSPLRKIERKESPPAEKLAPAVSASHAAVVVAEPQLLTHPPLARAQGIPDRTTPSNPRRKKGRKGASAPIVSTKSIAPVGGNNRFGALLGIYGNEGILGGTGKVPHGSTPSTTDSVLAACIYAASFPARRSHGQSRALLFRSRRLTSRRPRLPRRRAPSLPPAGSLGPSSAHPTCSASLASSRCSASEPRLRSPRTLPPPRFSPRSGTSPRLPFPQSQRRSRRHRLTASAILAATTPAARLQPSPLRTACPPTTRCLLARAC